MTLVHTGRFCVVFVLSITAFAADETHFEYGKACYAKMKVAIPKIDCLSPEGTLLRVTVDGKEVPDGTYVTKCDRPSHISQGGYSCAPGGRLFKWVNKNERGEEVTTVAICRRYRNRRINDPNFDDIGLIQHNSTTNDSCWFANTSPSDTGWNGREIPPPYVPGSKQDDANDKRAQRFWETPSDVKKGDCVGCHTAGVWIRTPFVTQAKFDRRGKNKLPDINHGRLKYVGKTFKEWNERPPIQLKINAAAYDKLYPPTDEDRRAKKIAGGLAESDRCTECHYAGKSQTGFDSYCKSFIDRSVGTLAHSSLRERAFGLHAAWMPPTNKFRLARDSEKFKAYYSRSIQAMKRCCDNPNLSIRIKGENVKVCQDKFPDPKGLDKKETGAKPDAH